MFFVFELSPFTYTGSDTKTALNFRFRLGKAYLFGYGELRPKKRNASKIGNDVIIFSTSLNPAMFGTIGFVSNGRFQKYIGKWD